MATCYKNFKIEEYCCVNNEKNKDDFVGLKINGNSDLKIYFPIGYQLPTENLEIKKDIRNLFKILTRFKENKLYGNSNKIEHNNDNFPIQSYLNVLDYYIEHNCTYYNEIETKYKIGDSGKINWLKTIKTQTPMYCKKSFFYLKHLIRTSSPNFDRLVTQINKYCVYESFKMVGWLYQGINPQEPNISLNKSLFISTLKTKLRNLNNDNSKKLFISMLKIINFTNNNGIDGKISFGAYKFQTIWEKLIDKCFGIDNKKDYQPRGLWTLFYGDENKIKESHPLMPDTIMIYDEKYYVIDSKYYCYGITKNPDDLPGSSDINKQITYGKFLNKKLKNKEVYNAFIMPFNKFNNKFNSNKNYEQVAEATGDWIDDDKNPNSYERIKGIVVDTRYLLMNYGKNHREKERLSLLIQKT